MIVPALAVAEKPLSAQEIADRTNISVEEIHRNLEYFLKRNLVVSTGDAAYELNPDRGKIIAQNIQERIETLRKNTKNNLAECENLLGSASAEYDGYDILMAKYLRERIAKMKLFTAFMTRRSSLIRLLDSSGEDNPEITKVTID